MLLQICQVAHGHLCRRVTGEEKKQPEAVTPVGVLYVIRGLTLGVAWGVGAIGGRVAVGRENNALAAPGAARE